jgi:ABC-type polysaccharide/polyol phosphate export permease
MTSLKEIAKALFAWRIWWAIAVEDVVGRYRRTVIGPVWLVLSQAAFIGGIYILHKSLFGQGQSNFLLYLSISLPAWSLLSGLLSEGAGSLVRSKGYIESYPLPLAIYLIRTVAAAFVTFAHLLIVFVVVSIAVRHVPTVHVVALVPALVIVAVYGFGVNLILAPIGARFRDVQPAIGSALGLLFVLTPIFWIPAPEQLGNPLLVLNPFYHLLEVVRQPLLGAWGAPIHWAVAAGSAFGSLLLGGLVYARTRPNVVYWL